VIVVTGNRDDSIARTTLTGGAFDYLPKPFDLAVLERIVAAATVEHSEREEAVAVGRRDENGGRRCRASPW
jgi:DNA-binding NtrC family response regulator